MGVVVPTAMQLLTVEDREAVGLALACVEMPPLIIPGNLMRVVVPSAVQLLTVEDREAVGLAPARVETPPLTIPGNLIGVVHYKQ